MYALVTWMISLIASCMTRYLIDFGCFMLSWFSSVFMLICGFQLYVLLLFLLSYRFSHWISVHSIFFVGSGLAVHHAPDVHLFSLVYVRLRRRTGSTGARRFSAGMPCRWSRRSSRSLVIPSCCSMISVYFCSISFLLGHCILHFSSTHLFRYV